MSSNEKKLQEARRLLKEGEFEKARKILKPLDDPTARKWLVRLDEIAPEQYSKRRGRGLRFWIIRLGLVVALGCCGLFLLSLAVGQDPNVQARQMTLRADSSKTAESIAAIVATTSAAPTQRATNTATPAPTATITNTPIPSNTPVPTVTPEAEDRVAQIVDDIVITDLTRVSVLELGEPKVVAIDYDMPQGFSGYNVDFTDNQMAEMVCALRDGGFSDYRIQIAAMIDTVDAFGNQGRDEGVLIRIDPERMALINCDNVYAVNIAIVADEYRISRLLQ